MSARGEAEDDRGQKRHDEHVAHGVDDEVPFEPVPHEELAEHQEREDESREERDKRGRAPERREDELERDTDASENPQVPERHEAPLEDPFTVVRVVLGVVLVLVEDPEVEEEEEDRESAQECPAVEPHAAVWARHNVRDRVVRDVVGDHDESVSEWREPLVQVRGEPHEERGLGARGRVSHHVARGVWHHVPPLLPARSSSRRLRSSG